MQQSNEKAKILGGGAMVAKLRRMAYQVYEKNFGETELVMVAVGQKGLAMAKLLKAMLEEISTLKVELLGLEQMDGALHPQFRDTALAAKIQGKLALIVDDVLYSGQTMFWAIAETMKFQPAKIQVAILIDRGHRSIPVTHDFVGMVLATSLRQYVAVEFDEDHSKASVYLY